MKNATSLTALLRREITLPQILTREIPLPRFLRHEGPFEKTLILLHALVALAVGYGLLAVPGKTLEVLHLGSVKTAPDAGIRLAGALLGGLALTLLCLLPMTAPEVRRRIAVGLFVSSCFLFLAQMFLFIPFGGSVPVMMVVAVLFGAALLLAGRLRVYAGWASFYGQTRDLQKRWQDQIRETAAQQERNRLARDLHDSIKQQIFSVRLASATAEARLDSDPAGAREALAHVRKSAQEAAVEMQALLHQLRPEPLANVGLVEALREQCEALEYRTGAQVAVEIGELPPDEQWPPAAQEALFRIAQEALSNVARHARASQVYVQLGQEGEPGAEALVLEVRDDGQGFDAAQTRPGMGLRNLRERLQPFAGNLEIDSAAGAGTRLAARLSLLPPGRKAASPSAEAPEEATHRIKGENLFMAFLVVLVHGFWYDKMIPFALGTLLYSGLLMAARSRFGRSRPVVAATRVTRLFLASAVFWTAAAGWSLQPSDWPRFLSEPVTLLAVLALSFGVIAAEGLGYARRLWRGEAARGGRNPALATLLLGFLLSLPALALLGDPLAVARTCAIAAGLFYVVWWMVDSLRGEER